MNCGSHPTHAKGKPTIATIKPQTDYGHEDLLDPSRLILIVTGSHLKAEAADRPIAYRLRERMSRWLGDHSAEVKSGGPEKPAPSVVVCSDLWYLNQGALRERPTVSVGGPSVNALSAYLGTRLPSALAVEGVMLVQADLEFVDAVACCWGVDAGATLSAVDAFADRYLDQFMRAALAA